jgi:tetratricopeptide (TPR) repeat protein
VAERPLCFVLMPFGTKKDPAGGADIDFDAIYEHGLRPGIEAAGMEPIRADEERTGGIIHRAMFERLLLCDFAVADLTTANANVFYELGVRHAARPSTTLAIFAGNQRIPFDLNYLRCLPYHLSDGNRFGPGEGDALRTSIAQRLNELRTLAREGGATDSPLFQLLTGYVAPDIARLKTDVFRQQVRYSATIKQQLADARRARAVDRVAALERELGRLDSVDTGVLVDLFLSYRALSAHQQMVDLYERLPHALQRAVLVREQLAFALNRLKRRDEALDVLQQVLDAHGPSSETLGLIGRIYKDLWVEARKTGDTWAARGHLDRAIASYVRGFEADWRDAYPGINAVTLLDVKGDGPSLARKDELLPVVRFAVTQRLRSATPDYWDYATLLELAVLAGDEAAVSQALGDAIAAVREPWEPQTTANNLSLIREARAARGTEDPWLGEVIAALERAGTPAGR